MKKIKTVMCACCAIASFSLISCMTVPKESEIPEDTTAADLTQKAQEAFDASNYRAAYAYYQIILNRFSTDESACVAAEYEIAHLHIKKRNGRMPILRSKRLSPNTKDQWGCSCRRITINWQKSITPALQKNSA